MEGGAALHTVGGRRGLGLLTKARSRMAQPPSGKPGPDYFLEAALAHSSAAEAWEALAERERLAVAANQALA